MNDEDLKEIGITEKGPRKIILTFISKSCSSKHGIEFKEKTLSNNQTQQLKIRHVLSMEPKFHKILLKKLDSGLIPETNELLFMNRILTKHYFERQIMQDRRYPSWQQKRDLAMQIVEEFSQLENTRVRQESPKESFFFWRHGGKDHGCHSGIIETRVGNMRKDVLPENRLFHRAISAKIIVPEGCVEAAALLAVVSATAQNVKQISDGMAECAQLHRWILNQKSENKTGEILRAFPHFLNYDGLLIQQAYERMHVGYNKNADLKSFLSLALVFEDNSWLNVKDFNLRGVLILMKKLGSRGIKRVVNTNE
ncbi:uncharacterized protein LOC129716555 [Wyeomyia smithii]|uniref:uncharacterized protein LOC129716555 n=1 Tax=Wyeomyia smithii TaxID=174621 RepID=UPI0024681796|nr:uncharacterized protein LOC129716555 [Wyeomyia smithii]XP_055522361.1 uncharacterized protein LOC129716555 [Wyeomyia smithii]